MGEAARLAKLAPQVKRARHAPAVCALPRLGILSPPMEPKPVSPTELTVTDVLPAYEPPAVVTYTDEQLLEALGPAQAARYGTLP